jgi:hypothetical protein
MGGLEELSREDLIALVLAQAKAIEELTVRLDALACTDPEVDARR